MIRDDLKEKLDGKSLDEVFLKHRPGIDQPGYRIGKVGEEVVILNESSGEIMDYFYDDVLDKEWFSLEFIDPRISFYEINRNGQIRNSRFVAKKNLSIQKTKSGYYEVKLYSKKDSFSVHIFIHRALCLMFLPNLEPETRTLVDHKDRVRTNNSLSNLRWVTITENNKNLERGKVNKDALFYEYSDKEKNNIIRVYTGDEIIARFGKEYKRFRKEFIRKKYNFYDGSYWTVEMQDLPKYLKSIGKILDEVKDEDFVFNPTYNILVHRFGLVRFVTVANAKYISPGTVHGGYRRIRSCTMIHVLVASTFLNNCQEIPEGMQIDHINGDCLDNRVENLRIVTPSENMSNPITKEKIKDTRSKSNAYAISNDEGKLFNTIQDCANYYDKYESTITKWLAIGKHGLHYIIEETQEN